MFVATLVPKPAGKLRAEMFASFGMPLVAISFIAVLFMANFNHMVFSAVHSKLLPRDQHCTLSNMWVPRDQHCE